MMKPYVSVLPALFALALNAPVSADALQSPQQATQSDVGRTTPQDSGDVTMQADPNDKSATARKKHPPTAAMDRATPTEKAGTNAGKQREHPPTSVMERATPDVKPQGSDAGEAQSSDSGSLPSAPAK